MTLRPDTESSAFAAANQNNVISHMAKRDRKLESALVRERPILANCGCRRRLSILPALRSKSGLVAEQAQSGEV